MIAIVIKLNLLWIVAGVIILPLAGFIFRSAQIAKEKRNVQSLEREMLDSHAEILSLQEKIATLQQGTVNNDVPVVPIKDNQSTTKYPPKDTGNHGALKNFL